MQKVTVEKSALLAKIQAGKALHRATFEQAVEGYRITAVEELEAHIARIKAGNRDAIYLRMEMPEDHTSDYEQIEQMLEMSVDAQVEITYAEFRNYVMDEWSWKREWSVSNNPYIAAASRS